MTTNLSALPRELSPDDADLVAAAGEIDELQAMFAEEIAQMAAQQQLQAQSSVAQAAASAQL